MFSYTRWPLSSVDHLKGLNHLGQGQEGHLSSVFLNTVEQIQDANVCDFRTFNHNHMEGDHLPFI